MTPTSLCLLTAQYVQGSAKYQTLRLNSLQRAQINALVTVGMQIVERPRRPHDARAEGGIRLVVQATVGALAAGGWLTQEQKATLITLAGQL